MDPVVRMGELVVVDDLRPARWLTEHICSFADNVGSLVPGTFEAYARLFHPAYRDDPDARRVVRWSDIARANGKVAHPQMQFNRLLGYASRYSVGYRDTLPGVVDEAPAVGMLAADDAAVLAGMLARHTAAADDCWFAVWSGRGDLHPVLRGRPTFRLPARDYHLARGPLSAAAQSVGGEPDRHLSCNLWWPDDHAWCVATEIDLDSTYLGASAACVRELSAVTALDVVPLPVTAGVSADSDTLNPGQ